MLSLLLDIFAIKENEPIEIPDIFNKIISNYNLSDLLIADGINLTRRVEYDDFQNQAFGIAEISLILTRDLQQFFIEWVANRKYFYLLTIEFNKKRIFRGYLDKSSINVDKFQEIITLKFDELLKNFFDWLDTQPLPVIQHLQPATIDIFLNTITSWYPFYLSADIRIPNFMPRAFQNSGAQESSYYRLSEFSRRHFQVDPVNYDKYSAKDFLIECLKYYHATLVEDPATYKICFYNKLLQTPIDVLDNKILEDFQIDYDFKKYDGFIANFYTFQSNSREGWFVYLRNTPETKPFYYKIDYYEVYEKNRLHRLFDLRYYLYSNMYENNAPKYIAGYTKKNIVFEAQFINRIENNLFYWYVMSVAKDYYDRYLLKSTNLIKCEVVGLDYKIGNFYRLDGKDCFLIEQKFNFDRETSELILRV